MIKEVPWHIIKSANIDMQYLLDFVNKHHNLDAELINMDIDLEDEDDFRYDVSVKSTIYYGYNPRKQINFDWDYFVDGTSVQFWGNTDINILANELYKEMML